jgi:ribosomal protein S18 acetylase RimI-like enzyme
LIIREATEGDFDAVAKVWKESWVSIGNNNEIDDAVTMADLRARIPDRIAGGWSLFVAECEGRIDAMLAIERAINHLDQVFVAPSAQGRRIGSALLAHARMLMPEEIWLSTAANNTRARGW